MLPTDYPEDFDHVGLREQWFNDVPWRIQTRAMSVNTKLRVVRNPVTGVFVFWIKLGADDPIRNYHFFGTATVNGWMPVLETKRGEPVEACYRLCEGMEASERWFRQHYGDTKESMIRQMETDAREAEEKKDAEMKERTRFASTFTRDFLLGSGSTMRQGMSPKRRRAMFLGAQKEFLVARARRETLLPEARSEIILP